MMVFKNEKPRTTLTGRTGLFLRLEFQREAAGPEEERLRH